ncbi:hypothetical protein A2276_07925 [candidate division WOR-1 bacterium RIFOXYA12_FULL_43_27]|uniref:IPT/TIG domain-containing protein n=1 Tax=candidate division WOR-1 bacterium RIFOXYC2_FULL_46_14 TaxID=1802587 RepID=A0A1F4U664_UNCSA|nr:MAG: hypothetical protein A2276_07925 [candidate division WOR-1 bacterium RIFOXYA12_FULL_43_27]OGC20525.1 MAG: hypothetical protein A2292_05750 [candidate division WOR-1 bacterium RIFOXYB2_FULL_46_45]OGC31738.1 MAG: hypothetical protein A2232_05700 [candidate division WOR-1 bacterium RIFOXYA2_FULL_46_56]OGC40369.1 MAG: hypothetical protein A2438_03770 [candidate division WOR-1 bacterium RIFOXYC2_FULL_46_14]
MKSIFKIGGLAVILFLLAGMAQAAVVSVSCSPSNTTPNPILNSSNANLASGAYVQVVKSTDSSTSAPKTTDGLPSSSTDTVILSGTLSAAGTFTKSGASIPTGNYVYIVAWETWNGTGTPTGKYGISAISSAMTAVSYIYRPVSFSTGTNIIAGPSISSISPTSGKQGETLSVTISGSGTSWTGDMKSSVKFSNAGITVNSASASTATTIAANITIASTAVTGAGTVSITGASGTAAFTVNTSGGGATTVVIDDFEGTAVNPTTGYYGFAPTGYSNPTYTRITSDKYEKSYSMQTSYALASTDTDSWRGWGGILAATQDLSNVDTLSFYVKGDGSTTNKVKIQFKDADGTNFAVADADAAAQSSGSWTKYELASFKTKMARVTGSTAGDANMDWSKVIEYQMVFTGKAASSGVLLDYVVATKGTTPTPTSDAPSIISISPAKAKTGDTVTITGTNLGTAGKVEFSGAQSKTYIESAAANSAITSWAVSQIVFKVPAGLSGTMQLSAIRTSDLKQSNAVTFEVTSQATGTGSYNYPNPFNPNGGESTTIVFDSGTDTTATIYIFNTAAEMVEKLSWTSATPAIPNQSATVTWNGKNAYGETLGDGAYLYRVAAGSKLIAKGKILVVNK